MRLVLASLVGVALSGQVQADFYAQAGAVIGPYQMYVAQICNGSDQPQKIMGAAVWRQAQAGMLFTPQLTSIILAEKDKTTKISWKARALQVCALGSALGTAATTGELFGKLSTESREGKAILTAAPLVVTLCAYGSAAIAKVPEREIDPRIDRILPGIIELSAHGCQEYVIWGTPQTR